VIDAAYDVETAKKLAHPAGDAGHLWEVFTRGGTSDVRDLS